MVYAMETIRYTRMEWHGFEVVGMNLTKRNSGSLRIVKMKFGWSFESMEKKYTREGLMGRSDVGMD